MPPKRSFDEAFSQETNTSAPDNAFAPADDAILAEFLTALQAKVAELNPGTTVATTAEPPAKRQAATEDSRAAEIVPHIPHVGKVKRLQTNFGTGAHERMHFAPTDNKSKHGVWGRNLETVKGWISLALDSIFNGDEYIVKVRKREREGECDYLVNMCRDIGYISRSAVRGTKPRTQHMALCLAKNGSLITAFPCAPEDFPQLR